jgi:DNA gyrase/topoisomerase IV subunit B
MKLEVNDDDDGLNVADEGKMLSSDAGESETVNASNLGVTVITASGKYEMV